MSSDVVQYYKKELHNDRQECDVINGEYVLQNILSDE